MRTCCVCGARWKTPKEDITIYGCAVCRRGSHIVNIRNMPRNAKFEAPDLELKAIERINRKLEGWGCALRWKIKEDKK